MKYPKRQGGEKQTLATDPSSFPQKRDEEALTHLPVLLKESVNAISPNARRIIDCTVGLGGHALAFLEKAERAELLGIDRDERMLKAAKQRLNSFAGRVNLMVADFRQLAAAAADIGWDWADMVFFDLGVSSAQLDDPERGFSFQTDGPLDMRFDSKQKLTAEEIVNTWEEYRLIDLFRTVGEEPYSRSIGRSIIVHRKQAPIKTTSALTNVIAAGIPLKARFGRKTHFATNIFRALRIAVNDELGALKEALPQAANILAPGGMLLVISFHSLEDRIAKHFIKSSSQLEAQPPKPIVPTEREVKTNPRARSAKLRIAKKHQ